MRRVLVAATLAAGGLAVPAHAFLPNYCSVVPATTTALVAAGPSAVTAVGGRVVGRIRELGVVEAAFPTTAARDAGVAALRGVQGVRFAEAEHVYRALRNPNDPYVPYQWSIGRTGLRQAWDKEVGTTSPVKVAVIDTGVDLAHPDLKGHVSAGQDVVNDDSDPTDDHGHGTHVAGIIAAAANNRLGVAGISWGAQVIAVKVLASDGSGSDCDVALGIVDAVQDGARVLNLSLGADGVPCGQVAQSAVDYATRNNALTVVAAGNNAKSGNKENAPADCDGVLAVGATDSRDRVASFSAHLPYVAVSAPGVSILSTYLDVKSHRHAYAMASGTSMAAPFVAGLAALLASRHSAWTPQQLRDRIVSTADDRGAKGRDDYYGSGRVNAARALAS